MGKQNLYEHNKPPLIFAGPGIVKGQSEALVYLFDLSTLIACAGLPIPPAVEGRSLLPILKGEQPKVRETLLGAYRDYQRMIRDDRWKLLKYNAGGVKNTQLFDLAADPDELSDTGPRLSTNFSACTSIFCSIVSMTLLRRALSSFGLPQRRAPFVVAQRVVVLQVRLVVVDVLAVLQAEARGRRRAGWAGCCCSGCGRSSCRCRRAPSCGRAAASSPSFTARSSSRKCANCSMMKASLFARRSSTTGSPL